MTRVLVRGRIARAAGVFVVGFVEAALTAAAAPCDVTECPSRNVPVTINARSSTAATPLATTAAVRHGRTASNGTACSTGASSSLPGAGLLQGFPGQAQAFLECLFRSPAEFARCQR